MINAPYTTNRSIQETSGFSILQDLSPSPTKMASQKFGALGATFTVVRAMQAISLITIIGMTSNFISEMVAADQAPPKVLIGTLSVVSCLFPPHRLFIRH